MMVGRPETEMFSTSMKDKPVIGHGHVPKPASHEEIAMKSEQARRFRRLFADVVLAALDDAIVDNRKYGNGGEQIARWARSRDGQEVLTHAGIDPNERVVLGLQEFVARGVPTSQALSRENQD